MSYNFMPDRPWIRGEAYDLRGYDQNRADFTNLLSNAMGGRAMYAPTNTEFRQGQLDLMGLLQAQSRGEGPNLADMQLRDASDRSLNQTLALLGNLGGASNPNLSLRQIADQRAQAGQALARQSAQVRAQEALQSRGLLAGLLEASRGQDTYESLTRMGLDDNMIRFALGGRTGLDTQKTANQIALEQDLTRTALEHNKFIADQMWRAEQSKRSSFGQRLKESVIGGAVGLGFDFLSGIAGIGLMGTGGLFSSGAGSSLGGGGASSSMLGGDIFGIGGFN